MSQADKEMPQRTSKVLYIELLRIFAIILVVFNHTRNHGYSLYSVTVQNTFSYWASLSTSIFCKVAVPIFFMISGGILLKKEESIGTLFRKRILRIVLVILVFTFLQYLRIYRVHPENGFRLGTWLTYCYCGNIIVPYWFLKAYLSMLLILPFLRLIATNMKDKHFYLLIGLKAFQTAIQLGYIYTGYTMNLSFEFMADIIFYPLLGYYVINCTENKLIKLLNRKTVSGIALLVCLAGVTVLADSYFKSTGAFVESFHTLITWMLALLFVMLVKNITIKTPLWGKVIQVAGGCTFGVYLIEDVVRNQFEFIVPILSNYINTYFACIVFVLISTIVAMVAIYIVKKIPYVSKLL